MAQSAEIKFYRSGDPYFQFTNFYDAIIVLHEKSWKTSEHFFQAMKFQHTSMQEDVRNQPTPRKAFDFARQNNVHKRQDWERVKEGFMMEALEAKFTQHINLNQMLLNTGNSFLVENSPVDNYWGIGANGQGQNRLGILLMQLRDRLRLQSVQPTQSNNHRPICSAPGCTKLCWYDNIRNTHSLWCSNTCRFAQQNPSQHGPICSAPDCTKLCWYDNRQRSYSPCCGITCARKIGITKK